MNDTASKAYEDSLAIVFEKACDGDEILQRLLLALYNRRNRFDIFELRFLSRETRLEVLRVIELDARGHKEIHKYIDGLQDYLDEWLEAHS